MMLPLKDSDSYALAGACANAHGNRKPPLVYGVADCSTGPLSLAECRE